MNNWVALAETIAQALPPASDLSLVVNEFSCSLVTYIAENKPRRRTFYKNEIFTITGVRARKGGGIIFTIIPLKDESILYVEVNPEELQQYFSFVLEMDNMSVSMNFNNFYERVMGITFEESFATLKLSKDKNAVKIISATKPKSDFEQLDGYGDW